MTVDLSETDAPFLCTQALLSPHTALLRDYSSLTPDPDLLLVSSYKYSAAKRPATLSIPLASDRQLP